MPRWAQVHREAEGGEGAAVSEEACAGQGAHREVGSEGFAANRRAVADTGDTGRPSPAATEPALQGRRKYLGRWTQQGVCGRHGGEGARVTPGDLVRSCSDGASTWAYKQ